VVELADIKNVVFVAEHGRFVSVDIQIVWSRKKGYYCWESGLFVTAVHAVSDRLGFVRTDDREKAVFFEKLKS